MPTNKLRCAVSESSLARQYGDVFKMAPNVFREPLDRSVAVGRLFSQGRQNDIVEVAPQSPMKLCGRVLSRVGNPLRRGWIPALVFLAP